MSEAEKITQFEGPNVDNDAWFGALPAQSQLDMNKFVERANYKLKWALKHGVPDGYKKTQKMYNKFLKKHNYQVPVDFESIYAVDDTVASIIYDTDLFAQIMQFAGATKTMTNPRFQLKDYLVNSKNWPNFTKTFKNPPFIFMEETHQFLNGVGIQMAMEINWQSIRENAGGLWDIQNILMSELSAKMGLFKTDRGLHGTSGYYKKGSDSSNASGYGVTGLFNDTNIQQIDVGIGNDNNLTAQGDTEAMMQQLLTKVRKVYQPHLNVLITTPGVYAQAIIERHSQQATTDLTRLKADYLGAGNSKINAWFITERLYTTARVATASTQQVLLACIGPDLIKNWLIYPTQTLSMANKEYDQDIRQNTIFASLIQVKQTNTTYNAVPLVQAYSSASTNVTTDSIGWHQPGRVF